VCAPSAQGLESILFARPCPPPVHFGFETPTEGPDAFCLPAATTSFCRFFWLRTHLLLTDGIRRGHTLGMKTAVSIPDQVFAQAEKLSRELGVSRSQLYTRALSRLVADYREEEIVRRLNEVYANEGSKLDPGWRRAQEDVLKPEEW
jgi:hypothetical protein